MPTLNAKRKWRRAIRTGSARQVASSVPGQPGGKWGMSSTRLYILRQLETMRYNTLLEDLLEAMVMVEEMYITGRGEMFKWRESSERGERATSRVEDKIKHTTQHMR